MRKFFIIGASLAALLITPAVASAGTVNSLTGDWRAGDSSVFKVTGGVHFGTYANAGEAGGSLHYTGANGMTLKDVTDLSYTFNYKQTVYGNKSNIAAPYMRIWLNGNADTIILDPSYCASESPAEQTDLTYQFVGNSKLRYTDDPCGANYNPQTWSDLVNEHGDEQISRITITQGFSRGEDVSAMLKTMTLNGEAFDFTAAPADGTTGSKGDTGAAGSAGTTTVIRETVTVGTPTKLVGNTLRTLTARVPKGAKFVSAKAKLRNVALPVKGNKVTVDLRNKPVGNYNVYTTVKYRKDGKLFTVRSHRSLSVHTG
jgi:hypothetical protein